jgi:hypothetical protein
MRTVEVQRAMEFQVVRRFTKEVEREEEFP